MRVVGVDFGGSRIGIAVGHAGHGITTARPPIAATGSLKRDAVSIAALAAAEEADAVVIGIPENSEDGTMARICRILAEHVREAGIVVYTVDESFSTHEAEESLRRTELKASGRRKRRDGESARIILERFFNEQG